MGDLNNMVIEYLKKIVIRNGRRKIEKANKDCGGVKPRPTIKAQEHRFIKSTPEEEKSLGHHGNTGA